jgi:hypothetical protein
VRARITGTQNIAKITKSMKMVSASKLRGDTQRLKAADPFSVINSIILVQNSELIRFFHIIYEIVIIVTIMIIFNI